MGKKIEGVVMACKNQVSVLVAEDNEVNQKIIAKILSSNGIDYKIVSNGEEAIYMYQFGNYGLILMDCQMPIMDGLVATERIRELEKTNGIERVPIVALTANAMKGDREKCMKHGIDDFLPKPFRMNQLLELIKQWTTPL